MPPSTVTNNKLKLFIGIAVDGIFLCNDISFQGVNTNAPAMRTCTVLLVLRQVKPVIASTHEANFFVDTNMLTVMSWIVWVAFVNCCINS